MKLKIFYIILILFLVVIFFLLFGLPYFFCCSGSYKLSKSEQKYMIEQAIQGNDTAMMKLRDHYLSDKTKGMYMFYWHKFYETKYSLSYDEYKQLSEYAKNGNETAKERLKWHNNIPQHKQEVIYDYFDKDAEAMQNFLNDCSYDSFCNSSDIYEHYSQKAKNTNENKTQ